MNVKDKDENDRDLYFDTDCLMLLEEIWKLSMKVVLVSSENIYFLESENKILTPLKNSYKQGSLGSDWKKHIKQLSIIEIPIWKKQRLKTC